MTWSDDNEKLLVLKKILEDIGFCALIYNNSLYKDPFIYKEEEDYLKCEYYKDGVYCKFNVIYIEDTHSYTFMYDGKYDDHYRYSIPEKELLLPCSKNIVIYICNLISNYRMYGDNKQQYRINFTI